MRRKDKEITTLPDLENILMEATVCNLVIQDTPTPYIIPLHFGYKNHHLYIHSANEGKKIELLKKNPHVCFDIILDHKIHNTGIPCNWSTSYKSIIGYGNASFITDPDEKIRALDILIDHYSPGTIYDFPKENIDSVTIIDIKIDQMTGKQSKE